MSNSDLDVVNLLKRLALLPTKPAKILESLLEVDHIDNSTLKTVLDAGDLSGETHRLPAFATSYLFLRSQDVPVADVIYMAKQHGRKVNLRWSAKRWKLEHDRLARYETLTKLAENNQDYDVAEFAKRLPDKFPGYLIKTSRRLGMEGLRQRHCVASYHDRIYGQELAICVVFIDSVRWTVELRLNESEEYPLTIQSIRSKLNQMPSMAVKNRIHDVLG